MAFPQPKMYSAGGITWIGEGDIPSLPEPTPRTWSPFDIHVMLHHFSTREPFHRKDTPAYADSMDRLTRLGLLAWSEVEKETIATPLGEALVRMWCETPVPEVHYVDPRLGRS